MASYDSNLNQTTDSLMFQSHRLDLNPLTDATFKNRLSRRLVFKRTVEKRDLPVIVFEFDGVIGTFASQADETGQNKLGLFLRKRLMNCLKTLSQSF